MKPSAVIVTVARGGCSHGRWGHPPPPPPPTHPHTHTPRQRLFFVWRITNG
jgi:hypothetical protein